jgi:hypothetical protein
MAWINLVRISILLTMFFSIEVTHRNPTSTYHAIVLRQLVLLVYVDILVTEEDDTTLSHGSAYGIANAAMSLPQQLEERAHPSAQASTCSAARLRALCRYTESGV